jgi:hypothetical protein
MTRVILQTIPMGYGNTLAEVDMTAFKAAEAVLDAEVRQRQAAIADAERARTRAQNARRARAAVRLRKMLKVWRRT